VVVGVVVVVGVTVDALKRLSKSAKVRVMVDFAAEVVFPEASVLFPEASVELELLVVKDSAT
jgi:hypothetical protein